MYPAYTQLVAKCSSPSIGDRRATGWKGRIADDHATAKMIIIVKSGNIKTCWLATGWRSTTIAPMIGLFGATYLAGQTRFSNV